MSGRVHRIRLEATGRTEAEVADALHRGVQFVAQSFGGSWYTDDEWPPQVQSSSHGYWGYVWLKRTVMQ
jgi:hypothetical protein